MTPEEIMKAIGGQISEDDMKKIVDAWNKKEKTNSEDKAEMDAILKGERDAKVVDSFKHSLDASGVTDITTACLARLLNLAIDGHNYKATIDGIKDIISAVEKVGSDKPKTE